jgi:PAS domain S-box-containing protein
MNSAEGSTAAGLQASETTLKPVFTTGYSVLEKPLRILHVDDDASILSVSKTILETENKFEIDNATSVDGAFKKLETQSYDAIVSDYEMPQKNGLDFLKELREKNNKIPFILFIGEDREDVAVKALNLDADSYINKNGSPETVYHELAHAINKTVEQKKSAQLLAASDSKYRLLVEKSLQGIMIAQYTPLHIIFANASMGKMLGYSPEELTSISSSEVGELIYHEDRAIFFNRFRNRLEGNQADNSYEFRALRKDGSIIWLEAFATLIEYNGQPAVQAMFLDINEHKKAEEILRRSEQRYRELANFLPEIVFETDITGKITFFNQIAFEITGFSPEELKKGMNMLSFVVPEEREKAKENIAKSMTGKNLGTNEYTLLRKNGSTFPALVRTNPIISETKVKGIRGIVMEITDRKQMENKLEQYSKHLEELIEIRTIELRKTQQQLVKSERFAAIGELAGIIGHDLRNPLTDIKNAAHFLKEKGETISEVQSKETFETIDKCINHSNQIINDLSDYSREIHLELRENSPRMLVLGALDLINIPENVIILNNVPEKPHIKVDSDRITRVFINLIRNGIEAIPKEGSITINCKDTKDSIEISFTDTGTGISGDMLPKIFSPIVTNKAQGMGFGLAICKRIIDAHAGTITIETVKGKGTTFTVTLPVKPIS